MPVPEELEPRFNQKNASHRAKVATTYQTDNLWNCDDCYSYKDKVEKILAWRSDGSPEQPTFPVGQPPPPKVILPREYLVKWQDRGYRRAAWVHHGWLAATHAGLLRSFLVSGPRVELLKEAVAEDKVANEFAEGGIGHVADDSRDSSARPDEEAHVPGLLGPIPDAHRRIPPAWKTTDRVLDCLLFHVPPKKGKFKKKTRRRSPATDSEEEDEEIDAEASREMERVFTYGEEPNDEYTETVEGFERRTGDRLSVDDVDRVIWAFIKWDDLGYEDGVWLSIYLFIYIFCDHF
jgi:chromodomain-helicase-DNA-binding protein 4